MNTNEKIQNLRGIKALISDLQKKAKETVAEICEDIRSELSEKFEKKGKPWGSVSLKVGEYEITVDRKQTVSWDQEKLRAVWEALPREMGDKLIKLEFSVAEATYNAQADPELFQALTDARTTSISEPTIKIK